MFARHVSMKLRADLVAEFARVIEAEVIPLLHRQEGFLDQIILLSQESAEAIVITFWDRKESEEAFNRTRNPKILRSLLEVIEGSPKIERFEVVTPVLYNIASEKG